MKTSVRESRLLVVSDVHMGNRLHRTRRAFTEFVEFALEHRYSICINGDGIDLAQLSLSLLVADITPSLGLFLKFWENDLRIYYTVGNHDIALEHFLTSPETDEEPFEQSAPPPGRSGHQASGEPSRPRARSAGRDPRCPLPYRRGVGRRTDRRHSWLRRGSLSGRAATSASMSPSE